MKAVGFSLDDFDLVIHTLQGAGANGIITMVQNALLEESQSADESAPLRVIDLGGHLAPLIKSPLRRTATPIAVDQLELVLQLIHRTEPLIDSQRFPQSSSLFRLKRE